MGTLLKKRTGGKKEDLIQQEEVKWGLRGVKKILFYRSFDLDTAEKCFPVILLTENNTDKGLN